MKIARQLSLLLLLALAGATAWAQDVTTNRATELRATPDDAGAVIQNLAERTAVQVTQKRGAWSQVRVGNAQGWVRMMHLRGGSSVVVEQSQPSTSNSILAAFTRLLAGAPGQQRATGQRAQSATVGIRGFSKEDVERAELNPEELEKLKGYTATVAAAQRLANQARLAFRSVNYLAQDAVAQADAKGGRK